MLRAFSLLRSQRLVFRDAVAARTIACAAIVDVQAAGNNLFDTGGGADQVRLDEPFECLDHTGVIVVAGCVGVESRLQRVGGAAGGAANLRRLEPSLRAYAALGFGGVKLGEERTPETNRKGGDDTFNLIEE